MNMIACSIFLKMAVNKARSYKQTEEDMLSEAQGNALADAQMRKEVVL
jgi:hypothetical protein